MDTVKKETNSQKRKYVNQLVVNAVVGEFLLITFFVVFTNYTFDYVLSFAGGISAIFLVGCLVGWRVSEKTRTYRLM